MLILDLKTVPDAAAGKRLLALERFGDAEALLAMRTLRIAAQGHAEVPVHLCRVVAAALVQLGPDHCTVQGFDAAAGEAAALAALEAAVAAAGEPVLLWDAGQSARALLMARALACGLALPALLAGQGPHGLAAAHGLGNVPLHELAAVQGLPHRLGLPAHEIEACSRSAGGRLRAGCEADALNSALLHLSLQVASGQLPAPAAVATRAAIARWLDAQTAEHWRAFRAAWRPA